MLLPCGSSSRNTAGPSLSQPGEPVTDACGTQGDWDRDRDAAPTAGLQDLGCLGWHRVPVPDGLNQPTSQNVESLRGHSLPAAQTPARDQ